MKKYLIRLRKRKIWNGKKIIDKRVDDIVSNSHRKSYFKAAFLIVALGEI